MYLFYIIQLVYTDTITGSIFLKLKLEFIVLSEYLHAKFMLSFMFMYQFNHFKSWNNGHSSLISLC